MWRCEQNSGLPGVACFERLAVMVDTEPMLRWSGTRFARASFALALACATALASSATGASSNIVVSADVPSASTMVTTGCTSAAATQFGSMAPGTARRTAIDGSVCRLTFGSSNDTAQLRISQKDGTGTAMAFGMQAPTELAARGAPGRTTGVFGSSDGLYAWFVGRSSTSYRTSDGGAGWNIGTTINGLSTGHTDVEFVPGSPATVWVTGDAATLRRATDGQDPIVDFTNQNGALIAAGWPGTTTINELSIPDNDTIYIVGDGRRIGVYDISANTWQTFAHLDATVGNVVAVDALDASIAMAVADGPNRRALLTTNKGTTSANWAVSIVAGSPGQELRDVAWGGTNRAYAVGTNGLVSVWDGASWTNRSMDLGISYDAVGVDSVPGSPDSVLVVDERGAVYRSDDAGDTWSVSATGADSRAGDIHAASATKVYVPASERTFANSTDGGDTWTVVGPSSSEILSAVAVSPTNGQRILAVGTQSQYSINGGSGWTSAATPGGPLLAVSLVSDMTGWGVSYAARIRHTTTLGASWTTQSPPSGVTERLLGVEGLDRYSAIAVGDEGRIIATTDGGATWVIRASGTTNQLTGVDSHGSTILAVGARGTVVRSTNAGETWSVVPGGSVPDTTMGLVGVSMASATVAYAATVNNDVWKSTDAGATWSIASTDTGTPRQRSIAAAGSTIFVVGSDYSTSRSFDGGVTWSQATGPTTMILYSTAAVDSHTAMIVGADGTRAKSIADAGVNTQVSDWGAPANDWDSGGFFGVCLQAYGGAAQPDWLYDTTGIVPECEMNGTDPWRVVPALASLAAHTNGAGLGTVDLVWGFRAASTQDPGVYEAGIAFETVVP